MVWGGSVLTQNASLKGENCSGCEEICQLHIYYIHRYTLRLPHDIARTADMNLYLHKVSHVLITVLVLFYTAGQSPVRSTQGAGIFN